MIFTRLGHDLAGRGIFCRVKARSFTPAAGETYLNRNGQVYECIRVLSPDRAVLRNCSSGWQFVAHRLYLWPDGLVEWGCSTDGRFDDGQTV